MAIHWGQDVILENPAFLCMQLQIKRHSGYIGLYLLTKFMANFHIQPGFKKGTGIIIEYLRNKQTLIMMKEKLPTHMI